MNVLSQPDMPVNGLGADDARRQARIKEISRDLSRENSEKVLRDACSDFEAIFIKKMWEQMKSTVPKEGYLHSKHEDMYLSMFDHEFSKMMSREQGIGLGDMLFDQLKSRLEKASDDNGPELDTSIEPPVEKSGDELSGAESNQDYFAEINPVLDGIKDPGVRADVLARHIESVYGDSKGGIAPDSIRIQRPDQSENNPYSPSLMPEMNWPAVGRISSEFGWRDDPFSGKKAWHAGVDIAVAEGTEINSCWPGKVVFAGKNGGYGNMVVIEHKNGWKSYYGHNQRNLVREGQFVQDGQKIALSGDTGRSTGPHLHFELRQGDQAWNPEMIRERVLAGRSIGSSDIS